MLLKQIQYFHAIVEKKSFTEAAEACFISQSAISQQMKALEHELGIQLLIRHNRTFTLTPAGEYFYKETLPIIKSLDHAIEKTRHIAHHEEAILNVGCLNSYGSIEFNQAVITFMKTYPKVKLHIMHGNHEELYNALRENRIDLALNDQRRMFSSEYENMILIDTTLSVLINKDIMQKHSVELSELEDQTCIVVASSTQIENEESYYKDILGVRSPLHFVNSYQEARLFVSAGTGYMIYEGTSDGDYYDANINMIPLLKNKEPLKRRYCAFWKLDNSGYYVETFADILKEQFQNT